MESNSPYPSWLQVSTWMPRSLTPQAAWEQVIAKVQFKARGTGQTQGQLGAWGHLGSVQA